MYRYVYCSQSDFRRTHHLPISAYSSKVHKSKFASQLDRVADCRTLSDRWRCQDTSARDVRLARSSEVVSVDRVHNIDQLLTPSLRVGMLGRSSAD